MKDLIFQLNSIIQAIAPRSKSSQNQKHLLFDTPYSAQEAAFMLGGDWDTCNGVTVSKTDEVAVKTVADLLAASWCYPGTTQAVLDRLSVEELSRRYATGERYFINANLRCANLEAINLSNTFFSYAKFNQANLSHANLEGADLTKADLSQANLEGASLINANLSRANLDGANLIDTDLSGANLTGVDLTHVDLSQTK